MGVRGEGAWELSPHRYSAWGLKGTTVPGDVGVLGAAWVSGCPIFQASETRRLGSLELETEGRRARAQFLPVSRPLGSIGLLRARAPWVWARGQVAASPATHWSVLGQASLFPHCA